MASAGATIWLPDTERFFVELITVITRAQQQRNERTLSALTTRIEESSQWLYARRPGRVSINYQMPGSQTFYTFKGIALVVVVVVVVVVVNFIYTRYQIHITCSSIEPCF